MSSSSRTRWAPPPARASCSSIARGTALSPRPGGDQGLNNSTHLKSLPIFLGAGERDFGLADAKKLHASLVVAGSERAVLRVFSNTEHPMFVEGALPEVFALFDELAGVEGGSIEPLDPQRTDR